MLYTFLALPTLALPKLVLAATYTVTLSNSTTSSVVCYTYSSTVSPKTIATHYSSKQLAPDFFIFSSTSTPYRTVTPKPSTTTSTSTIFSTITSTPSTSVETFTTTESFSTTTTLVSTATDTETSTSTDFETSTSTSVIPTPSGFITADDSTGLTNGSQDAQRLLRARNSFGRDLGRSMPLPVSPNKGLGKLLAAGTKYEYKVVCITSIQPTYTLEVIKFHSTIKKIAAPSTITITSDSTSIVTTTTVPTASTTQTISTTTTSTEVDTTTITSTTTTTTTMTGTITTSLYAACSGANLLGPEFSNGQYLSEFATEGQNTPTTDGVSAEDCCTQCFETTGCLAVAFFYGAYCELVMNGDGSCPAGQVSTAYLGSSTTNQYNGIVSNGPCGQVEAY